MPTASHATTLRDYLQIARRRKWVIILAGALVPVAAVAFSLHQQKLYRASSQVLINAQNLTAQLTGVQPTTLPIAAQAELAHSPAVAKRALPALRSSGVTLSGLLGDTSIGADPTTNVLTFSVTMGDPVVAKNAANAYAQAFTEYRSATDTAAIHHALALVDRRLSDLEQQGQSNSLAYTNLIDRQQTLQTMQIFQTANATVLQQAGAGLQTQPKTSRNAILGLVLGVLLGGGLAILLESLDTRVRSTDEIDHILNGSPLLARVATPPKRLRDAQQLVMVAEPNGLEAEAFRMLRMNLDFVRLERNVRTLMITSAVEREGKSTTIANLAVALARSGSRVVLVDLDLRRPLLADLFGLDGPGVSEVALGRATLEEALASIVLTDDHDRAAELNGNGSGDIAIKGVLEVLPSGPIPPNPGEFVGTQALASILVALRERADIVLIDAPPVLHVGDAIALSTQVDGIIVAVRLQLVRRNMLHELARQLATAPTPVLGVVATGASTAAAYGYGYGYRYQPRAGDRSITGQRAGRA